MDAPMYVDDHIEPFSVLKILYPDATPAFQVPPATCELVEPRPFEDLEREFWAYRARRRICEL